jgi:hypothetical protein
VTEPLKTKLKSSMTRPSLKSLTFAFTLLQSPVSVSFLNDFFRQTDPDLTVYSMPIRALRDSSKRSDGKLVRVKATLMGLGIDTPPYLAASECDTVTRIDCRMGQDAYYQMYSKPRSSEALQQIDVVGRFSANAELLDNVGRKRNETRSIARNN